MNYKNELEESSKVPFTFRIDPELLKRFKKACKKEGRTYSGRLSIFITEWLEELENSSKKG